MNYKNIFAFSLTVAIGFSVFGQAIPQTNQFDYNVGVPWKVIGPGGGGGVFLPTISPFNIDLVLSYCDMTGAYLSENGGNDWRMINFGTVPIDFAFDPIDSNTIYVATRGYRYAEERGSGLSMLFRSTDRGKNWSVVYPDINEAKKIGDLQGLDYQPSEVIPGSFDATIQKIAIDPRNNNRIYLGLSPLTSYLSKSSQTDKQSLIIGSTDSGKSWKLLANVPGDKIVGLFVHQDSELKKKISIYTETAAFRISDQNGESERISLPVKRITSAKNCDKTIYLQSDLRREKDSIRGGIYISGDLGNTWIQRNAGLLDSSEDTDLPQIRRGFAVSASDPKIAYLAVNRFRKTSTKKSERMYCIYKTIDGGLNWKPVLLSSTREGYITNNFSGSWMEKSYDPGWGQSPIDLAIAPQNPDICFASDEGRAYKTIDGGSNWQQQYSKAVDSSTYSSNGLDVTTCYGIHFDPFDKDHFFICYTDIGLFHTFDGGKSWRHAIKKIPRDWQNTCYDLAFDPKVKGKVWSVWANAHDLPREKMFHEGFDNFSGGVAVSYDGGLMWEQSNQGISPNAVCTGILVDTASPADARILYVSVFGKGVYKSIDGGKNWQLKNNGLTGNPNLFAWELRKGINGRIWLLCTRGLKKEKVIDGILYYSDNKGETWSKSRLPEGVNGPHDLLIDPIDAKIMYLSCWPRRVAGEDKYGGVFKSTDGGITWSLVFDQSVRVNSAEADINIPGKVYINTFQKSAFSSDDYGKNWKKIPGYNFKWGQRVVPDKHHPGMIYLTTYGGSVFYGPSYKIE